MIVTDTIIRDDAEAFHGYVLRSEYGSALQIVGKYFSDSAPLRNIVIEPDAIDLYRGLMDQGKTNEAKAFAALLGEDRTGILRNAYQRQSERRPIW